MVLKHIIKRPGRMTLCGVPHTKHAVDYATLLAFPHAGFWEKHCHACNMVVWRSGQDIEERDRSFLVAHAFWD